MQSVGIDYANVSKKERLEAEEISETILKSRKCKKSKESTVQHKVPKVWDALALDLFLGNIDKKFWLWEDSKAVHLLDYWKSLDEQLAFILVYTDPKTTLNNFLATKKSLTPKALDLLLQEWFTYNTTLLNFFYKNQDRALLVNANQLDKNHSKYISQLSQQIGLKVKAKQMNNLLTTIDTSSSVFVNNDSIEEYMSETLLYEYPEQIALYEELQSVANIYNTEDMYIKNDVKDAFCTLIGLKNKQNELEEESSVLENTLHKKERKFHQTKKHLKNKHKKTKRNFKVSKSAWEEKVERFKKTSDKREKKLQSKLSKKIDKLQKIEEETQLKEGQTEVQKREQQQENELLLQQLHHVQEELEKYYLENSDTKNESQKLVQLKEALETQKKELEMKLESTVKSVEHEKLQLQKELDGKMQVSSEKATKEKTQLKNELDKTFEIVKDLEAKNKQTIKHESEQKEENELLLQQLHHVQEELEKYYLENQRLKEEREEKKRYYGAAERVKEQLSYRLGAKMIEKSKSFFGILGLPFSLMGVRTAYKKDLKIKQEMNLPPIENYADAYDVEKVKGHLSYMLGQTMIKTMKNPFGIFVLPFKLNSTHNEWKKAREF